MARKYLVRINTYRDYELLNFVSQNDWTVIEETSAAIPTLARALDRALDTMFSDAEELVQKRLLRYRNIKIVGSWEDSILRRAEFQLTELGRRAIADFEARADAD